MAGSKAKSTLSKTCAEGKRFGIAVSKYHEELSQALLKGALQTLESAGAKKDDVSVAWVPGSFELPLAARALVSQGLDAVVCLGIIVKGETTHDQYIATEVARGISALAQSSGVPVGFGVLTTQNVEQAEERCGGKKGNKGAEAAEAVLQMLETLEQIKKIPAKPGKSVGF